MEILDSALKGFDKVLEDDKKGIKPLFRSRNWNKEEREVKKKSRRLNLYKNNGKMKIEYTSVLFVLPSRRNLYQTVKTERRGTKQV